MFGDRGDLFLNDDPDEATRKSSRRCEQNKHTNGRRSLFGCLSYVVSKERTNGEMTRLNFEMSFKLPGCGGI